VTLVDGGFEDPNQGLSVGINDVIVEDFDGDGVSEAVVLFGCFFGANANTDQAQVFEVVDDGSGGTFSSTGVTVVPA